MDHTESPWDGGKWFAAGTRGGCREVGYRPRQGSAFGASVVGEELADGAREPRHYVFAGELVAFFQDRDLWTRAVDGHAATAGVDHPYQSRASREEIIHFLLDLLDRVAGGDELDG